MADINLAMLNPFGVTEKRLPPRLILDEEEPFAQIGYAAFRAQVRSFTSLPKGWDTYAAEPPGGQAVQAALSFIDLVEEHALEIKWLAPSVDDSVMVLVATPSGEQEWEFFGDGGTAVMYRDANGGKAFVDLEAADFERFLTR